jgi:hypothetical protein
MNTRKAVKENYCSQISSRKDHDLFSYDVSSKSIADTKLSSPTRMNSSINYHSKTDHLLISSSYVDNITFLAKLSLREILDNAVSIKNDQASFQHVIDHISNHSFGPNNRHVVSESFLAQVRSTTVDFYNLINGHHYEDVKIQSAREYVDKILGERTKVNKKRKMHINDSEKEASECQYEQRLYYDAVFLLMFMSMKRESLKSLFYTQDEFMQQYGDLCQSMSLDEIDTLVLFRNVMKAAIMTVPAFGNKGLLLDLVTRLVEGHHRKYVTGSGATIETKRRVQIYEHEGEIKVIMRPERRKIKDARILGSLHKIQPKDVPYHPPVSENHKPVIISPSMKSSGLEREAAESIALLQNSPPGASLAHDLRLEESQESGVWHRALNQFSKETPLNRNHSLI